MHGVSHCCGEACSRRGGGGQDGEVEPSQVAVEVSGGDAPEAAEEVLELALAAVDRLNVQGAAHPLPGRGVERLVAHAERGRTRGISAMGVGEEQDVFRDCGFERVPQGVGGDRRQHRADRGPAAGGGHQYRNLFERQSAPARLAAAAARRPGTPPEGTCPKAANPPNPEKSSSSTHSP